MRRGLWHNHQAHDIFIHRPYRLVAICTRFTGACELSMAIKIRRSNLPFLPSVEPYSIAFVDGDPPIANLALEDLTCWVRCSTLTEADATLNGYGLHNLAPMIYKYCQCTHSNDCTHVHIMHVCGRSYQYSKHTGAWGYKPLRGCYGRQGIWFERSNPCSCS